MKKLLAAVVALPLAASAQQETTDSLSGSALIDALVRAKWAQSEAKPSARCGDAEFMRRVSLDIAGRVPSVEEAQKFLASKDADKREKYVDELLKSPAWAQYWAEYWTGTLLGVDDAPQYELAYYRMVAALRQHFEKSSRHDEFAKRILLAEGKSTENGLTLFYVRQFMEAQRDLPLSLAGKFSRTFLGVQIQCAQCHDHPFDSWTQEEFYAMAGFFTKVGVRRVSQEIKDGYEISDRTYARPQPGMGLKGAMEGDLTIPDSKGGPVKTKFIGTDKGPKAGEEKREAFARILTAKDTVQFARGMVNRMWAHFFGRGIVEPFDDFTEKNKPWHPELLDRVAQDFIAHEHDSKWLMKAIALSEPYQLSSKAKKGAEPARSFERSAVRALSPEQILHSVIRALGQESAYAMDTDDIGPGAMEKPGDGRPGMGLQKLRARRQILEAVRQFRFNFSDDEGADKTEFQGTIPQALLMMNSEIVAKGLATKGDTRLAAILKGTKSAAERIAAISLAVLSRPATEGELDRYGRFVRARGTDEAYADVMWAMLNSSEFLFNH